MKRVLSLLLTACFVFSMALPAAAEDLFDRSYRRFNDYAGTVTEEQETQLNDKVRPKTTELQMDFPVCVYLTRESTTSLSEFAADYYARNKFGCGEDKSGIILVMDLKQAVYSIYYYGEADTLIGEKERQTLSDSFKENCRNETLTYYDAFDRYYDDVFAMVEEARIHPTTTQASSAQDGGESPMPDWYPENTDGFTDFHGENLPPVVDDAHIFTAEQFRTLSDKISGINTRLGIGYAAFTSDDNHGIMPEEYSSDFLHFNGYGVGDEYGAVVFYLSLDPEDRCWLTTSINSYERLFTADVTYEIDEMVDSSIRGGDYYDAFVMHADYVEKMFANMSENLPSWYPEGTKTYALDRDNRTYGASIDFVAPRITDDAGVLPDDREKAFSDTMQALSNQYGLDLVIFTDSVSRAPYASDYAQDFYYYNGYSGDGIFLYLMADSNSFGVQYFGKGQSYEKLKLETDLRSVFANRTPDEAMERYLELLSFMLEKNRLPMHVGTAIFCLIIGMIAGLIAAGVVLSSMEKKMKITQPNSTYSYLDNGSFRLHNTGRYFLYSTVTRTARPKPTESSSSSGSSGSSRGGSSYTSGRSAGGSYSSGGRRF